MSTKTGAVVGFDGGVDEDEGEGEGDPQGIQ
jgi:hypothetical protein